MFAQHNNMLKSYVQMIGCKFGLTKFMFKHWIITKGNYNTKLIKSIISNKFKLEKRKNKLYLNADGI